MANLDAIADGVAPGNRWKPSAYIATGIGSVFVIAAILLMVSGYSGNDFVVPFVAWIGLLVAGSRANLQGWSPGMEREPSAGVRRAAQIGGHAAWLFGGTAFIVLAWPFDADQPITVMPYTLLGALAIIAATREAVASVYLIWFTNPPPSLDDFW